MRCCMSLQIFHLSFPQAKQRVESELRCRRFAETRSEEMGIKLEELTGGESSGSEEDAAEERRKWREQRATSQASYTEVELFSIAAF